MKNLILTLSILCISTMIVTANDYTVGYRAESIEAIEFYQQHYLEFENIASHIGVTPEFLFAIVAPEISQYNRVSDASETYTLKVLYVQGGQTYSDFSIGYFQMKPSFVERLEADIKKDSCLLCKYSDLLLDSLSPKQARIERVKRLGNISWQLKYLEVFCVLTDMKFGKHHFLDTKDKLAFYASAYNIGYHKSFDEIQNIKDMKSFPRFAQEKYAYHSVSTSFYKITN